MFLTFKGSIPSYVTVMSVSPPIKAPVNWEVLQMQGVPGVKLTDKIIEPVVIPVRLLVEGKDHEEYLRNCEDFADWLECDEAEELVFSDNPDRTYYAVPRGEFFPDDELNIYSIVSFEFFVPDGRKWGPEKAAPFVNGAANIFNRGTLPVKPIVFAEVLENITYLDVLAGEKFMRIGKGLSEGQAAPAAVELLFHSPLTNLTGWSTVGGQQIDGGTPSGAFMVINGAFGVTNYGTGAAWKGPSAKQAIPGAPLADWRVEYEMEFPFVKDKTGRGELYLLSDTGAAIAKLALVNQLSSQYNRLEIRIGGGANYKFLVNGTPAEATRWNGAKMYIRLERKGNLYSYYAARINKTNGKHEKALSGTFRDDELLYTGNLSQVQLHTGVHSTREPAAILQHDIKVSRLNNVPVGDPRVIAKVGDIIELNFPDSAIYINGEERKDLKDMFATFFKVPRGNSVLAINPASAVNAVAVIREGYQ